MAQKIIFIDRDGTIIKEAPPTYKIDSFTKLEFYPLVFQCLSEIVKQSDYKLVMVTNQDGLGDPDFNEEHFWTVHKFIIQAFANEGINFDEVLIDKSYPEEGLKTRKPNTGLVEKYMNNPDYDLGNSFMIGDRITDIQFAYNLGCKGIWLNNGTNLGLAEISSSLEELKQNTIVLETPDWEEILSYFIFIENQ